MSATTSHLQLEGYFLKELTYSMQDEMKEFPQKRDNLNPVDLAVVDTTQLLDQKTNRWRCELMVESIDNQAYDFKIVMVGFFTVNPDLDADRAVLLAETNCPAVLYSTAREIIATVTRRSPYPGTLLPLVTFIKPPEKLKGKPKASANAPKKAVK